MIAKFAIVWVMLHPIKAEGVAGYEKTLSECQAGVIYMQNITDEFFKPMQITHYCKIIWEEDSSTIQEDLK